jgi:dolichol-phosphate mannosyltransferase
MPGSIVCVPTYCEVASIGDLLRRTRAAAPTVDILVIDDSSPDGTADVVKSLGESLGQIDVLVNPGKAGLGAAYRKGFELALARGYDVVCQMDADLSHDPLVLPRLIAAVENGVALAIGSRYVAGGSIPSWPPHRRALSRYGNAYARVLLGLGLRDLTAGFRAYSAAALAAIDVGATRSSGYGFAIECTYLVCQQGLSVRELPITFVDRVHGRSKLSSRAAAEELALVTIWGIRDRVRRLARRRP